MVPAIRSDLGASRRLLLAALERRNVALLISVPAVGGVIMRKSNFALRLQPSLLDEARKVAETEGVALNQLINVAVAEKLSALRTETYIAERAARADIPRARKILRRAGAGRRPVKGDEPLGTGKKR